METGHPYFREGRNRTSRAELLAPAGNPEGFYGAVRGGADAVYLAGNRFGARAYADNFTSEELVKCIRYGHLLGKKIYLAVNTLLKERETEELYDYLRPFYEEGLDAVIVQDPGVLRLIRQRFPGLKLHASTQMTLCGGYGARLLQSMGVSRIVPARELGLSEICLLKNTSSLEIECFIHGAMCYSYSGQCLFSSILGGRSGNRGRCAQPCRLPYTLETGDKRMENCHVLSCKDLCTIEHIPRLMEAGIDSFKIEGRMKKPEYTAGVTQVYRRYIDKYCELREKHGAKEAARIWHVENRDRKILRSLYIRSEVMDGYYFRHSGREMITLDSPAYNQGDETLLAEIRDRLLKDIRKIPIGLEADFRVGKPAGITARWLEKGKEHITCTAMGDAVSKALKQPVTRENLSERLGKLGDSAFYAEQIRVILEENAFYPLGQINELRREAVRGLEEKILLDRGYENHGDKERKGREFYRLTESDNDDSGTSEVLGAGSEAGGNVVSVGTPEQLQAVGEWLKEHPESRLKRIYINADLILQEWERVMGFCRGFSEEFFGPDGLGAARAENTGDCGFFAALPYIIRAREEAYLENVCTRAEESGLFRGFLVRSMDGLGYLRERYPNRSKWPWCRADAGIYVWNGAAEKELSAYLEGFCLPYELNAGEQRRLLGAKQRGTGRFEKIVYGRIPMMLTANCLRRTAGICPEKGGTGKRTLHEQAVLTDRYRKKFPVEVNCLHCMNIIYNSVPLSLHRELPGWKGRVDLRMDFTLESPAEVKRLLDAFLKGMPYPEGDYTAGHEKRGVE